MVLRGMDVSLPTPENSKSFLQNGDSKSGCNLGKKCKFFHPPLCWTARDQGICNKENCKFQHIKGTRFTRNKTNNNEPERQARSEPHMNLKSYASAVTDTGSKNLQNRNTWTQNLGERESTDGPTNFLEMQRQMIMLQQQMQNMISLLTQTKQWPPPQQISCQCRQTQH